MNKSLQFYVGHVAMDGAYLLDGEFTGQDRTAETQRL